MTLKGITVLVKDGLFYCKALLGLFQPRRLPGMCNAVAMLKEYFLREDIERMNCELYHFHSPHVSP